jgi:uncharacterized membrane protein YfcA
VIDLGYTLSGFVVGGIVGLTGVGGGSLMTPLLVLFFGVSPATAVGTDLLYAAATKAGGAIVHGQRGHVRSGVVARLAAGSVPGALATIAALALLAHDDAVLSRIVTESLGVALLLTATAIVLQGRLRDRGPLTGDAGGPRSRWVSASRSACS